MSGAIHRKLVLERRVPAGKMRTIHYGIDLDQYRPRSGRPSRARLGFRDRDILLGMVARLSEEKGHRFLLEAAPAVLKRFPSAKFLFAGDGREKNALERQAERLKIGRAVHFLGFRSDIQDLLSAFDVVVVPSRYEGFPNAVLEAMACGRPVVATRVGGTPEAVVENETGLLVAPENPDALALALIRLLENPERKKRMGTAGRKRVETCFALEKQIEQFLELYRECHSSRRYCHGNS